MEIKLIMKQKNIATAISIGMIILTGFLIMLILPYIYIWTAYQQPDRISELPLLQKAYNVSTMKFQKIHVIDMILQDSFFTKKYDIALEYIEKLENMGELEQHQNFFVASLYCELGNYEKALKYAYASHDKWLVAKSYIGLKDYKNAENIINKMLAENPDKIQNNLHKAELELAKGNYKEAEIYINKTLPVMQNSQKVWKIKARIARKLGKTEEAKTCEKKLRALEIKYNNTRNMI